MRFEKFLFDELEKRIGNQAIEAIMVSRFLNRLQDDPVYVHHYDEGNWTDYVLSRYEKKNL